SSMHKTFSGPMSMGAGSYGLVRFCDQLQLGYRSRLPEIVALQQVGADLAQRLDLRGLLDAFGDRPQAHRARQRHDRLNDGPVPRLHRDLFHERLSDLQRSDWIALQVTERRVSDAEIVDGDPHTQ